MLRYVLLTCAGLFVAGGIASSGVAFAGDGNRLAYLDELNPWHPSLGFPKLTTPQWVGEEGVECVVTLAIDDMRDPAKYEAYLRPILNRLKQIDGRAPVSIMTCSVKPDDPQLQAWLDEGLSLECHTVDHPCPLLGGGDLAKAKSTYDRCVDLMSSIPRNKPVAFRMPCCDSLNTVSPRFYSEIFNRTTEKGRFLQIDSSVFQYYTSDDPEIPRELAFDVKRRERFLKYLPKGVPRGTAKSDTFVNYIENYPYPYIIGNRCWEFPCMAPSDWSAQHLHQPNNPETVFDWKYALDITVKKQGVFNLVFHPHNWIKPEQIVELIDYAVMKHGKKVKFLTFRECLERLNENLKLGEGIARSNGWPAAVRLVDIDQDGRMDLIRNASTTVWKDIWEDRPRQWRREPVPGILADPFFGLLQRPRFGVLDPDGPPAALTLVTLHDELRNALTPDQRNQRFPGTVVPIDVPPLKLEKTNWNIRDVEFRFLDLDDDGRSEYLCGADVGFCAWRLDAKARTWEKLPFVLPGGLQLARQGKTGAGDPGLRFLDLDHDGDLDIVFSNHERYGVWLFESMKTGWSRVVVEGKRGAKKPEEELPPIVRADGSDNGFFVHRGTLYWQNEDTDKRPDLVDRRHVHDLLQDAEPSPKSPAAALRSMRPRPGFKVELMAAEPMVMDPVAFEWGADGKLWVVEMADYPLGLDGKGKPGGRVRFLEDTDDDGRYDKSTLFLDDVPFPTGVLPWKKGVLVTAAPDIFYAEDTDGDGKADVRAPLYTGFAEGNQQHRVNGLVRGLDGWIYCANGDSGGKVKSLKTGKTLDIRGRDLRIKPETGEMETVAGQSQFGRNRDDFGNWFGGHNSRPMWHYVLDEQYLKRNPHFAPPDPRVDISEAPGAAPVFPASRTLPRFNDPHAFNRFTSACSAMIYNDDLFGPAFQGNAFVCEPVHNLIHREIVTPHGATFTSRRADDEQTSEFLASTDNWFRPVMVKSGPDGALWIADMYRETIEHPEWIPKETQKKLDLRAGHDKGRIWRVYPVGKKPILPGRLDRLEENEVALALGSPTRWVRDQAMTALIDAKDLTTTQSGIVRNIRMDGSYWWMRHGGPPNGLRGYNVAQDQGWLPKARIAAQEVTRQRGIIKGFDLINPNEKDPLVLRHTARLFPDAWKQIGGTGGKDNVGKEFLQLLRSYAESPDLKVVVETAYALGEIDHPDAAVLLVRIISRNPEDRHIRAAVLSSMTPANSAAVLSLLMDEAAFDPKIARIVPDVMRSAFALRPQTASDVLDRALRRYREAKQSDSSFREAAVVLSLMPNAGEILKTPVTEVDDPEVLLRRAAFRDLSAQTRRLASDVPASADTRLAAVKLMGRADLFPDAQDDATLGSLLSPHQPPPVREAAVGALIDRRKPDAPARLVEPWKSYGPELRSQVLDALLNRPEWRVGLVEALEKKALASADFDAARRQRLLGGLDSAARARAEPLLAGAVNVDRAKVVDGYRTALSLEPSRERGAAVFKKACANCHKLGGAGHDVGPDLGSVKDKSPEALLVAMFDPNRVVESRYVAYVAELKSGLTATGVLASESATGLTLRAAEGKEQTILRTDLESFTATAKSLMPVGIEKDLKPQDVADLIGYVRANVPLPAPKEFPGNRPAVVTPDEQGVLRATAPTAEIYGNRLVFEQQHRNLGWWASDTDRAVWTLEVKTAGKYRVDLQYACDPAAGGTLAIVTGTKTLLFPVATTKNWDDYVVKPAGELDLAAGRHRIELRSEGPIRQALLDLKAVVLTLSK